MRRHSSAYQRKNSAAYATSVRASAIDFPLSALVSSASYSVSRRMSSKVLRRISALSRAGGLPPRRRGSGHRDGMLGVVDIAVRHGGQDTPVAGVDDVEIPPKPGRDSMADSVADSRRGKALVCIALEPLYEPSLAISASAAAADEAGFCPVRSSPSSTTYGAQSSDLE